MADTLRIASTIRAAVASLIGSAFGVGLLTCYVCWRYSEDMLFGVLGALLIWGAVAVLRDALDAALKAWRGNRHG